MSVSVDKQNRNLWVNDTCYSKLKNSYVDQSLRVFLNNRQVGKIVSGLVTDGWYVPLLVDNSGYIMYVSKQNGQYVFTPSKDRPGSKNPWGGLVQGSHLIFPCD